MKMYHEKIFKTKICTSCTSSFNVTDNDLEFYNKISPVFGGKKYEIPVPTLCPDCRDQRRLSFFNLNSLYKNICLKCDKEIISRFSKVSSIKNYCNECWSEQDWNQLGEGIDINFKTNLFSQFSYLIKNTYYQNLIGSASNIKNNSVYTNHTSEIRNSYYIFEANNIDESYFGYTLKNSKNIVDSMFIGNSQYAYECIDCYDAYRLYYSNNSFGCRFSFFLNNCQNCSYCIGCVNLNNKNYYLFNEQISKEKYEEIKTNLSNYDYFIEFKNKFNNFLEKEIKKSNDLVGSENCTGNNIINSNNCIDCYDILECNDCKYCNSVNYSNDLFDVSSYGEKSNLMYESASVGRFSNNIIFSSIVGKGENLIYCIDVKKSKNCFLCINLKDKEYCILNKQYTKDEYNKLVPKIINHMEKTGEWGEFFPSNISPFGYNETVAMEFYPLNNKEVLKKGFKWLNYEQPKLIVEKIIQANKLPNNITNIPNDILNRAIKCEETDRPFRITKQELEFYRKHNLPIPRKHPDTRHLDRMKLRNERKLYDRKCDKCRTPIKTTYNSDKEVKIYCEECYNWEIY